MKQLISLFALASLVSCSTKAPERYVPRSSQYSSNATPEGDERGSSHEEGGDQSSGQEEGGESSEGTGEVVSETGKDPVDSEPAPMPEAPKDYKSYAASLDNFRWSFPCDKDVGTSDLCDSSVAVDETKTLGGDAAEVYDVELRFRGVVEPMMYKDGKLEGQRFYIGGSPNNGTYNIYSIEVSSPKQIYYLNQNPSVGHDVFLIDYKANIKMNGGATIKLVGNGQNKSMIANFKKLLVPELDMAGKPFNGQYIQMNVVDATLVP